MSYPSACATLCGLAAHLLTLQLWHCDRKPVLEETCFRFTGEDFDINIKKAVLVTSFPPVLFCCPFFVIVSAGLFWS